MLTQHVETIYKILQKRYQDEFVQFLKNHARVKQVDGVDGGTTATINEEHYTSNFWQQVVLDFYEKQGDQV